MFVLPHKLEKTAKLKICGRTVQYNLMSRATNTKKIYYHNTSCSDRKVPSSTASLYGNSPTSKDFTYTRVLFNLFRNVMNYRNFEFFFCF